MRKKIRGRTYDMSVVGIGAAWVTNGIEMYELQNGVATGSETKHDRMSSWLQVSENARERVARILARMSFETFMVGNVALIKIKD